MQAEERKKRIAEITRGNLFSNDGKGKRLRYCGEVKTFVEYEIPIELLVFNVENGRIASMVKSFEREHSSLNPEVPQHAQQIAQFLFDSNEPANEKTKKSIAENGQLETGIITSDGVIVDGNRRASLMLSILHDEKNYTPAERARCEKFRAVVLPEDANEKEILRLETTYQMGADEKVGYNPIEKYLHARDMVKKGFTLSDIAEYMALGTTTKVQELLDVMALIDDYLDCYEYTGIYTRLPRGFEDDMRKLNQALKKIQGGKISWIPTHRLLEVQNDLKLICFDFIRLNAKTQEGFDYRAIASTNNNNFLQSEEVWDKFVSDWQEATGHVRERSIDDVLATSRSAGDSERLLESRDQDWRDQVQEKLLEGYQEAKTTIENQKEKEKPSVLIKRAISALSQIDQAKLSESQDKETLLEQLAKLEKIYKKILNAVK